ncbi:MAG TPA: hypothetical protein PLJ62_03550 [Thermoflexales bacterium]|nr:hypothetical protein [Thermoflexales bacterium]HQW35755.1 hypothetical protein [Thermoflexales bacterium]HQZ21617.1 hypothetical protein [Thermoflexales bacterium]HQZ99252.1 hypothetical protein [Thermoflexales bacterium]
MPKTKRRRPFALYAIIIFQALLAIMGLMTAIVLLYEGQGLFDIDPALGVDLSPMVMIGLAIIQICAGIGLWFHKYWAWLATMLLTGFSLVTDLMSYSNSRADYLSMLIGVLIVFYLNQRDVQYMFSRASLKTNPNDNNL